MTHDLLISVIESLDATVDRLVIDKMVNSTFHAKIEVVTSTGERKIIDARPSDGIALAIGVGAPIFVSEKVFKKAAY